LIEIDDKENKFLETIFESNELSIKDLNFTNSYYGADILTNNNIVYHKSFAFKDLKASNFSPYKFKLNAIAQNSKHQTFVFGNGNLILKSNDQMSSSEINWDDIQLTELKYSNIRDAAFTFRSDGLAVGDDGLILYSNNEGDNWTKVYPIDYDPNVSVSINSIQYLSSDTIYAASSIAENKKAYSAIHFSLNAGNNWKVNVNKLAPGLNAISFSTDKSGIIVGDSGSIYKINNNNDAEWERIFINTKIR